MTLSGFDFQGKRVLLTGAAGGVGTAIALRLAREGAQLALADRDVSGLDALGERLAQIQGRRPETYTVDLASPQSLEALCRAVGNGPLDVLINNAGIAPGGVFAGQAPKTLDAILDINLRAVLGLTHRLLPRLLQRPEAAIANVASAAGLLAPGGMAAYAASKFGVVGFSEALRAELRGRVRVCVVCPAFVQTDIMQHSVAITGEGAATVQAIGEMVHRYGLPADRVARAVLDGIRRDRGRVVPGLAPHLLLLLRRLSQPLTDGVNHRLFRHLCERGILQ